MCSRRFCRMGSILDGSGRCSIAQSEAAATSIAADLILTACKGPAAGCANLDTFATHGTVRGVGVPTYQMLMFSLRYAAARAASGFVFDQRLYVVKHAGFGLI